MSRFKWRERPPTAQEQVVLNAFDAGEKNASRLGRLYGFSASHVGTIIRRNGRTPRSANEAKAEAAAIRKAASEMDALRVEVVEAAKAWTLQPYSGPDFDPERTRYHAAKLVASTRRLMAAEDASRPPRVVTPEELALRASIEADRLALLKSGP